MKTNQLLIFLFISFSQLCFAQVGINTTTPEGALDVVSSDQGIVVPRVSDINDVTDGQGNPPVDGTVAYDTSTNSFCFRAAGQWICTNSAGTTTVVTPPPPDFDNTTTDTNYFKASNTDALDQFGYAIDISLDGNTLAIGANNEDSNATGVNGNQADNSLDRVGAVYIFTRSNGVWSQQAYIKPSNSNSFINFGHSVSLSGDGNLLAVGALNENSGSGGIGANQNDSSKPESGAAYVFTRSGSSWSQIEYIKAPFPDQNDNFGQSIALSSDGSTLAVGARREASNASGINGDQTNNSASASGAAYVYSITAGVVNFEAYIKASNSGQFDQFGWSLDLSADGNTLAVGAFSEASNATGVNGDQTNNSAFAAGAVYIFVRNAGTWTQEAYIKASNAEQEDEFGYRVALASDGNTLAVGAHREENLSPGINPPEGSSGIGVGAVYIFTRSGSTWTQEAYIKASNPSTTDLFGESVALTSNGNILAVGASSEDSNASGIDGDQNDNSATNAGAVYLFIRENGVWTQDVYLKSTNAMAGSLFGFSAALSSDGSTIGVGAPQESSSAVGLNGDQNNTDANSAGAAYVFDAN